jgi:alpha-L-arabinofuranosidase
VSFDQFPCPVLRFPGGCASCTYHWEHGIGPVHRRPVQDDPVFKYKLYYEFGTDEYLELCAAKNIRPQITLNSTTATPEDAAGWAAYIRNWYVTRKLKVPAAYFAVGNENYGAWEIGHMTGDMYVAQLREFVPAVRAAYPEARILVLGEAVATGLRDQFTTPWRATILAQVPDLCDTLVVTRYSYASDNLPPGETMQAVVKALAEKEADLRRRWASSNGTSGLAPATTIMPASTSRMTSGIASTRRASSTSSAGSATSWRSPTTTRSSTRWA